MKKVIALVAVCAFAFALVSCGKKTEEASTTTDSSTVVVETPAVDSAMVTPDSTVVVDSATVTQ